MELSVKNSKIIILLTFLGLTLAIHIFSPSPAFSDYPILKKIIIAYNKEALEQSLPDGSYRGEEGILRIRPEIGGSFGMRVFIDQDYLDSMEVLKEAGQSLEEARMAMASKKEEKFPGEYAQRIADHFLLFMFTICDYDIYMTSIREVFISCPSSNGIDFNASLPGSSRIVDKHLEHSFIKQGVFPCYLTFTVVR